MTRQQLENFLKKDIPQASLLYGDSFWIEFYAQKIASQIEGNIVKFYFGEYEFSQVLDLLGQSSLFGDATLVILKIDKKISKKELQSLLKALEKNTANFLILEFHRSDSKSTSEYARDFKEMATLFKGERVVEVRFFEPNSHECQTLLYQRAQELGIQIEMRSLLLLLNIQNGDIAIALKELEKFVHFNRPIQDRDIEELCSSLGCLEFEDLLDALLARKEVLEIYARLEEEGLDEMGLLNAIGNHFYRLFLFFAYIRSNGRADAKEILGYAPPQFVIEKLSREAMSLREGQYKAIFEVLIKWRLKIFSKSLRGGNAIVALNELRKILG